jgi:Protein of unknown function (DUF3142)
MSLGWRPFLGLAMCLPAMALAGFSPPLRASDHARLPATILWAWERPEDLRFIDPHLVGVAFLSRTVRIEGDHVIVAPRRQPLSVPPGTSIVAVVRIETSRTAVLDDARRASVARAIVGVNQPGFAGVQIDFDAIASERSFYRALLRDVRVGLPAPVHLSITALASWCHGDPWLEDLPIDDAVPMLFRMGPDGESIRRHLSAGGDFAAPRCRSSVGLSTDEPWPRLPANRRFYIFHPRSWNGDAFHAVFDERRR